MDVIITQKDREIMSGVQRLMSMSKTNLTRLCSDHGMDYQKTYHKLTREEVSVSFITDLVEKINPKARIQHQFSLSLMLNDEVIINQKSKSDGKEKRRN